MRYERYDTAAEENVYHLAIPETPFEIALLRTLIEQTLADTPTTTHSIAPDEPESGWWKFYVAKRSSDFSDILSTPCYVGRIGVCDREYPATEAFRIMIAWEIDVDGRTQGNHLPYLPVMPWTFEKGLAR